MADKKTQEYARYLSKDGETRLIAAENLETARADGWAEPTQLRGNGEPFNPPMREGEGLPQAESAAEMQKAADEQRQRFAEEDAKKAQEQFEAAEKARAERGPTPDMTVAVVQSPTTDSKQSTAKKSSK
jgi:hypothetical protein